MQILPRRYFPDKGRSWFRKADAKGTTSLNRSGKNSANLKTLLENRYGWMNEFIRPDWVGADIGCGAGLSHGYIRCKQLLLTDYGDAPHLDKTWVDANHLPFEDQSFDFLIASNMIHHLSSPMGFLQEARRVLKPKGRLLINEPQASVLMCLLLRLTQHEGYDFDSNVFDTATVVSEADERLNRLCSWLGNNAVARLLFDQHERFHEHMPGWSILVDRTDEFSLLLNSGGVDTKTIYVPLPAALCRTMDRFDKNIARLAPNILAMGRRIALEKQ